jgi:hypothetical protein
VRQPSGALQTENPQDFRMNFGHQTPSEPLQLFLDGNVPVGFHKPTMKAADRKISHAHEN